MTHEWLDTKGRPNGQRDIGNFLIKKTQSIWLEKFNKNAKMNFNISLNLSSFSHANTHSLVLKTNNLQAINLTKKPATNVNCGFYHYFLNRKLLLIRKLLNHGFLLVKLKSSRRTFYGHHHDLVNRYEIYVSMCHLSFPHSWLIFTGL